MNTKTLAILIAVIVVIAGGAAIYYFTAHHGNNDNASTDDGGSSDGGGSDDSGDADTSGNTDLSAYQNKTATATVTSGTTKTYSAAYLVNGITVTESNVTFASTTSNQVVFLVINGGKLTLTNCTITKTGDTTSSSSDDYDFYGMNSAVVVIGSSSTVILDNCTITTAAKGADGVFAINSGTATIAGLTIDTTSGASRGFDATYDGSITATDVSITTAGEHCAAVATDRGGGTITITGSTKSLTDNTLTTKGADSPCVYSTGAISVSYATGTSAKAQTVVVEGKNSITLNYCDFTSTGYGKVDCGVMLYQSTSGDASDSDASSTVSTLTVSNSTLKYTGSGPMIYVCNTKAVVNATSTTFTHAGTNLISAVANSEWGTSGSNGGTLTFNASSETSSMMTGTVYADSISAVTLNYDSNSSVAGLTTSGTTVKLVANS